MRLLYWNNQKILYPLAEKYPGVSSYTYCMNNPVNLVNPDGKDGVVTGTGTADDPYVVTANYYYYGLSKDQVKGLNSSISDYNNKGKLREIKTQDGKIYVKFNLSATESKDKEFAIASAKGDMAEGADGKNVRWGNVVTNESLSGEALANADNMTIRSDNDKIVANSINGVNSVDVFRSTFNHEIGHNLGGVHGDPDGMMDPTETFTDTIQQITSGGPSISRYFNKATVTNNAVRAIMGRVGKTTQVTSANGNVYTSSYGIKDSVYLNAKENSRVDRNGSNGKISKR